MLVNMVNMILNAYNVVDAICTVDIHVGESYIDQTCTMVDNGACV